jgi:hypothetical protein
MRIIDEKSKRGHKPQRWIPIRVLLGILVTTFFVGIGIALLVLTVRLSPTELELQATMIVSTNCTLEAQFDQLPDVARDTQVAIDSLDIATVTVNEVVYIHGALNADGSECLQGTSKVLFDLTIQVDSLSNIDTLMGSFIEIFDAIEALNQEPLPTSRRALEVGFVAGTETQQLHVAFEDIAAARARGLTGIALLEALGGWR